MQELIQAFYARRAFRPAWGNAKNAAELRRALADSAADGLDPADYELELLTRLGRELEGPAATSVLRAQYDILHTEALLRLAYHLSFGKVDAESFDPQWNFGRTLAHRDVERGNRRGARCQGHLPAHRGAEADAPPVRRPQARARALSRGRRRGRASGDPGRARAQARRERSRGFRCCARASP